MLVALRTRQVLFAEEVNPTVQQPVDDEEDLDEILMKLDEEVASHQRSLEGEADEVDEEPPAAIPFPRRHAAATYALFQAM